MNDKIYDTIYINHVLLRDKKQTYKIWPDCSTINAVITRLVD